MPRPNLEENRARACATPATASRTVSNPETGELSLSTVPPPCLPTRTPWVHFQKPSGNYDHHDIASPPQFAPSHLSVKRIVSPPAEDLPPRPRADFYTTSESTRKASWQTHRAESTTSTRYIPTTLVRRTRRRRRAVARRVSAFKLYLCRCRTSG